jgi:hypothetical protein
VEPAVSPLLPPSEDACRTDEEHDFADALLERARGWNGAGGQAVDLLGPFRMPEGMLAFFVDIGLDAGAPDEARTLRIELHGARILCGEVARHQGGPPLDPSTGAVHALDGGDATTLGRRAADWVDAQLRRS